MNKESYLEYLKSKAVETGKIEGHTFFIVPAPLENTLNGYLYFEKKPVRKDGYYGLLRWVPVHGGITLAKEEGKGMIYGFDTLHHNSREYPRTSHDWIKKQIKLMLKGILKAKDVELKYLKAIRQSTKIKYAQMVLDVDENHENEFSFGAMIGILCGKV